jgi:hypothetical protein
MEGYDQAPPLARTRMIVLGEALPDENAGKVRVAPAPSESATSVRENKWFATAARLAHTCPVTHDGGLDYEAWRRTLNGERDDSDGLIDSSKSPGLHRPVSQSSRGTYFEIGARSRAPSSTRRTRNGNCSWLEALPSWWKPTSNTRRGCLR